MFFNQTCIFSLGERLWADDDWDSHAEAIAVLATLRQSVDDEIIASGASGVAAEALRHTVYCLLEAQLDDDLASDRAISAAERIGLTDEKGVPVATRARELDPAIHARVHEFNQNFFQGVIVTMATCAHDVCKETALTIASKIDTGELRKAPAVARYRLSERIFCLDFLNAPAVFLSWMYRIDALSSKKFASHWATSDIPAVFKARVGLLCEFILMRSVVTHLMRQASSTPNLVRRMRNDLTRDLSDQAWDQLHEFSFFLDRRSRNQEQLADQALLRAFAEDSFDLGRLDDGDYLIGYLEYYAQNEKRCRFWNGPQHSWTGVVGAGMIHGFHIAVDPKRKITRNGNNHSKRYDSANREDTVSEHVSKVLKKYGLASMPGSLYETYRGAYLNPAGLLNRAKLYHAAIDNTDLALPASHEDTTYLATVVVTTS
ncbi:hypothetical protein ATN89_08875 [Comamonas thiooxydans]|nr:hypothetical protein ATN89_08875 [Comamonas thiooxydans]